ncbi:MarR family winged helix-turn-helix transcriptional regulator [Nocardioides sp. zg-1228]|uniref:MarR family winged helix-turn-helix transcriptional regulator n=1 Tax=Nocardioides sp. zg-1228 TaxID=2763008 RepID=UPI0016426D3B|nr:MarR family winged helix-turn-helix transcriptional regulator [Nocardioides sp. zg-1228]MBC2934642.1 winged helix-turn-helix transcriptional regulator [Nocardioides sp. zg-1228]QSF59387.1 winged helix-turn-helix transcriptional regulator [Nocardioides sp. zg-1228]
MSRSELVYDVLRHVRPLVLSSGRVVERRVRREGWTLGMRAVVEALADQGDATVPAIGQLLDLPRQAVQRHVNDLVVRGHVDTHPNPTHRRSVLVRLTDDGLDAFERVRAAEMLELADLADECSSSELLIASRVLAALLRDVRAKAAAA